jgi:hypothetical protein
MRRSLLAASAALLASSVLQPLGAQSTATFPTNDPVLQRIWAIGMDSSHTMELATVLFDSLEPWLMARRTPSAPRTGW